MSYGLFCIIYHHDNSIVEHNIPSVPFIIVTFCEWKKKIFLFNLSFLKFNTTFVGMDKILDSGISLVGGFIVVLSYLVVDSCLFFLGVLFFS
jgi:hypothetical protein